MAKKKAPARKGGAKKCAPKKAVKRKPIPQQVTEKAIKERQASKPREQTKTTSVGAKATAFGGPHSDQVTAAWGYEAMIGGHPSAITTPHPTVEEQFDTSDRWRYVIQRGKERTLPAPPPPGPKSKFWRQYQDETGKFIGWRKALTKTKDQVISRLRLRKKPA